MIIRICGDRAELAAPHDYTCMRVVDTGEDGQITHRPSGPVSIARVDTGRVWVSISVLERELRRANAYSDRWFTSFIGCTTQWGWERCGDELGWSQPCGDVGVRVA